MKRSLAAATAALVLASPAAASPAASPAFDVQHFEFSFPGVNPCTGTPHVVTIVEDFYVQERPSGLTGIIETITTTSDGWSNGGPRVVGTWLELSRGAVSVFGTVQNDVLTGPAGGAIHVHANVHLVSVDGEPVVVRVGPPRVTCVPGHRSEEGER